MLQAANKNSKNENISPIVNNENLNSLSQNFRKKATTRTIIILRRRSRFYVRNVSVILLILILYKIY